MRKFDIMIGNGLLFYLYFNFVRDKLTDKTTVIY